MAHHDVMLYARVRQEESSQGELSFHEELSDEGVSEHGTEEDVTGGGKAEGTGSCMVSAAHSSFARSRRIDA